MKIKVSLLIPIALGLQLLALPIYAGANDIIDQTQSSTNKIVTQFKSEPKQDSITESDARRQKIIKTKRIRRQIKKLRSGK